MLSSTTALAALFALLPFSVASPTPLQRRFTGATIRSYRTNSCLTVQPGVQIIDGSSLTVGDCSKATKWDINPGSGSVVVSGTNFALDAGTDPKNNVKAKVWTSYPGLTQQTWYLTPDNRIAITGGTQCLDQGDDGPQTYQCTPNNTNQVWYVDTSSSPSPSPTASPSPSGNSTSSTTSPSSSATPGPTGPRTQIKWLADPNACITVTQAPANGVPVLLQKCYNSTDPNAAGQMFFAFNNGAVQLAGSQFCLDAGAPPSNGGTLKLWECYFGVPQQTFTFPGKGLIQTANNQCVNVDNKDFQRLQTWSCSDSDVNQQFSL